MSFSHTSLCNPCLIRCCLPHESRILHRSTAPFSVVQNRPIGGEASQKHPFCSKIEPHLSHKNAYPPPLPLKSPLFGRKCRHLENALGCQPRCQKLGITFREETGLGLLSRNYALTILRFRLALQLIPLLPSLASFLLLSFSSYARNRGSKKDEQQKVQIKEVGKKRAGIRVFLSRA